MISDEKIDHALIANIPANGEKLHELLEPL